MESNLHNSYVFKALDAYPYNLEEAPEALNYALSYNPKDAFALYLMGRVYAEQLYDYNVAKEYYVEALSQNVNAHFIYPYYVQALLWNDDYKEADYIIDFALNIKGIDKGSLHLKKAQLFEATGYYELALNSLKKAKIEGLNNDFIDFTKGEIARVKKKMKPKKKKKKNKKKQFKKKKTKLFFGLL